MEITKIAVFQAKLPQVEGNYCYSDGKTFLSLESTVVAIHTANGIVGYGEVVPLGPTYLPAYSGGVVPGIKELAPHLIGADASNIKGINAIMDSNLKGHPYVKAPIDIACWDALGKMAKQPVSTLLGGRLRDEVILYKAIPQRSSKVMAELLLKYKNQGYKRFQLKVGSDVAKDIDRIRMCHSVTKDDSDCIIWPDGNTAWTSREAIQVANGIKDLNLVFEQPCLTMEECSRVRQHCNLPFLMDEAVFDIESLLEVWKDSSADLIGLKLSKLGGITKMKQALDLCVSLGFSVTVDDSWGADFNTYAVFQLACTVPEKFHFASTDLHNYNTVHTGHVVGGEIIRDGRVKVPTAPGLGIEPNREVLAQPVFEYPSKAV